MNARGFLYDLKWFVKDRVKDGSVLKNFLRRTRGVFNKMARLRAAVHRLFLRSGPIRDIGVYEYKVYSQNGEDGILHAIFKKMGTTNRFGVEFGVGDGRECNTRYLCEEFGWTALLMDGRSQIRPDIRQEFITAENINHLFEKYKVPTDFDLLSIDIDGNDYWVWRALDPRYRPRVVVVEYNAKISPQESQSVAYDPDFSWDGSDYFGASVRALAELGARKGYHLVGCEQQGVNAFFVQDELARRHFHLRPIAELYRPPRYGKKADGGGWPRGRRTMVPV